MSLTYTIRESRKAKHVSLKISVIGKLEVIVPQGFDQDCIPAILQKKRRWIDRVMQRVEGQQISLGAADALPEHIFLQSIGQTWQVEYRPTSWLGVRVLEKPDLQLILSGTVADQTACRAALQQWVMDKARAYLVPQLWKLSRELNLPIEQVTVRQQKTRWGSCSARKTISLNAKLLFLPEPLVQYVLIHELCHTIHLNHSSKFWALVEQHEPDYRQLDAGLQDARYCVPLWMEQ